MRGCANLYKFDIESVSGAVAEIAQGGRALLRFRKRSSGRNVEAILRQGPACKLCLQGYMKLHTIGNN